MCDGVVKHGTNFYCCDNCIRALCWELHPAPGRKDLRTANPHVPEGRRETCRAQTKKKPRKPNLINSDELRWQLKEWARLRAGAVGSARKHPTVDMRREKRWS